RPPRLDNGFLEESPTTIDRRHATVDSRHETDDRRLTLSVDGSRLVGRAGAYEAAASARGALSFPSFSRFCSRFSAFLACFLPASVSAQSSSKTRCIWRTTRRSWTITPISRRFSSSSLRRLWLPTNARRLSRTIAPPSSR